MVASALPFILPQVSGDLGRRKYANFLLSLMARRRRDAVVGARPFDVTIDPSTLCQLRCPYCDVGTGTIQRGRSLLKPLVHRSAIEQLAADAFVGWYFSTGEPLINRRFAEVVSQSRDAELYSIVSTNLSLRLSDKRIDELLSCGLRVICVALDGASPETYVKYRVGGDFDLVLTNIRRILRRRAELGLEYPLLEWRFLIFRHNQHEVETARALSRELGMDLFEHFPGVTPDRPDAPVGKADPYEGVASSGPALEAATGRSDTPLRAYLLRNARTEGVPAPPEHLRGQKCDWLYFGTTLFPNGNVSPCCVSNHEPDDFGRVEGATTFDDVWNNERYRTARTLFTSRQTSSLVCSRCPLPSAQDYQFQRSMQAILRNAPDWALHAIQQDPARFFCDIDFYLCPEEVTPLRDGLVAVDPDATEAREGLRQSKSLGPVNDDDIRWLRGVFSSDSVRPRSPRGEAAPAESVQGYVDQLDGGRVQGWARCLRRPKHRLTVTITVDGRVVGHARAAEFRPDVRAAFGSDGYHGFVFVFPPGEDPRAGSTVTVTAGDDDVQIGPSPWTLTEPHDDGANAAIGGQGR